MPGFQLETDAHLMVREGVALARLLPIVWRSFAHEICLFTLLLPKSAAKLGLFGFSSCVFACLSDKLLGGHLARYLPLN